MPQLQVLEKVPGFGERLGQALGAGLGEGINQRLQKYQQGKQYEAAGLPKEFAGLDPGIVGNLIKQKQKQSLIEQILGKTSVSFPSNTLEKEISDLSISPSQKIPSSSSLAEMSPQQRIALSAIDPQLGAAVQREEKLKIQEKSEMAKRHYDIAKKTLESTAELAEALPQKESALIAMEDAIKSNKLGFFTKDNLAELTGIEGLRSPEGSVFKSASKEFLMGNLSRIGARGLNQWLERQVSEMAPKLGRETSANLAATEILKTELDLQKKQVELTNKIAEEMEKKHGFVKRDLSDQVRKELTPYAVEKQKELKKTIEDIKERYQKVNSSGILMRDPAGNLRRIKKDDLKKAREAGYEYEK